MAKKFTTSTSSAKAAKDSFQLTKPWHSLRSRIEEQSNHFIPSIPQLKPLRSDIAAAPKRKSSSSRLHLKSFYSDPTAGTMQGNNQNQSKSHATRTPQKNVQPVQKKKVAVKKQQPQNQSKPKVKPQLQQKVKEPANKPGKSNKKSQKSQMKTTQQKRRPKQHVKKSQSQLQQQQKNQRTYEWLFGEQQKLGGHNNNGYLSYELNKKPLQLNFGLNSSNYEKKEFDFDGFFWKVAERRLEANRKLLLEARADLATLRSENQKLRSVLLSTKREGEKYKRQLENEVFRKFMKEDM